MRSIGQAFEIGFGVLFDIQIDVDPGKPVRDIEHCEDRELSIQEQINEFTESKRYNRSNPDHRNHLGALHRWLQQWQERKTSFDQRLQRPER